MADLLKTATSAQASALLQISPDAYFIREPGGVRVSTSEGSFVITGSGTYDLVGALFEGLHGRRSLEDLCHGLTTPAAVSVEKLVEVLVDRGVVRRRHDHDDVVLPPGLARRHAPQIALLDMTGDYPQRRFLETRKAPITCVGSGASLDAVVGALSEFGFTDVVVRASGSSLTSATRAVAAERAAGDLSSWIFSEDGMSGDDQGRHLVLASAPPSSWERLVQDERSGFSTHVIDTVRGHVVAMPNAAHDGEDGCWNCVLMGIRPRERTAAGLGTGPVSMTIAALHLVQELFLGIADGWGTSHVVSVDPQAPVMRSHTVPRHPLCRAHPHSASVNALAGPAPGWGAPVRPDIASAEDSSELTEEYDRIVRVAHGWTDPVFGPILELGEGAEDQVPLASSTCRIIDPLSLEEPTAKAFRCLAVSPREARSQSVLYALEWAAERVLGRGTSSSPTVVSAGWSRAEALWRLRLRCADPQVTTGSWTRMEPSRDSLAEHLSQLLSIEGLTIATCEVAACRGGLAAARVVTEDEAVHRGVGLGPDHALAQTLFRMLADCLPGRAATAVLAPPTGSWGHSEEPPGLVDITRSLPWVADGAHLVSYPKARLPR